MRLYRTCTGISHCTAALLVLIWFGPHLFKGGRADEVVAYYVLYSKMATVPIGVLALFGAVVNAVYFAVTLYKEISSSIIAQCLSGLSVSTGVPVSIIALLYSRALESEQLLEPLHAKACIIFLSAVILLNIAAFIVAQTNESQLRLDKKIPRP